MIQKLPLGYLREPNYFTPCSGSSGRGIFLSQMKKIIFIFIWSILFINPAMVNANEACTIFPDDSYEFENSDAVFVGKVVEVGPEKKYVPNQIGPHVDIKFKVVDDIKNATNDFIAVETEEWRAVDHPIGRFNFDINEAYLVFANKVDEKLRTGSCAVYKLSDEVNLKIANLHQFSSFDKNSIFKTYYPNGNLKTENSYANGKRHGPTRVYYLNGSLQAETQYHEGNLVVNSQKLFFENGQLQSEYAGESRRWYDPDGKLKAERFDKDDIEFIYEYTKDGKKVVKKYKHATLISEEK